MQIGALQLRLQASLDICFALSSKGSGWGDRSKEAALKFRVDHDYVTGGERPEGRELRDKPFTVSCISKQAAGQH